MKTATPPRTSTADIETMISTRLRNLGAFLGGQKRKNTFLEGMAFALFVAGQEIRSGAAAGLALKAAQPRPTHKARTARA
jgi:hypothetical protein